MVEFHSPECNKCGEGFHTKEQLAEHALEHTEERNKHEISCEIGQLKCNFCTETFKYIKELMIHKKKEHAEKVTACRNHTTRTCSFGDSHCWFSHEHRSSSGTLPETMNLKQITMEN